MTTVPADGTVWRITSTGGGHRWLRLRENGPACPLPPGWTADRCPYGEPSLDGKPRELRWLWRMTEAASAWGWRLRPVIAHTTTVGWELLMEDPTGGQHYFTWINGKLITTRETITDIAGQLSGTVLTQVPCLL